MAEMIVGPAKSAFGGDKFDDLAIATVAFETDIIARSSNTFFPSLRFVAT